MKLRAMLPYVHSLFQSLLILYLVLLLANQYKPLVYPFYLNVLLGALLVLGATTALTTSEKPVRAEPVRWYDHVLILALGVLACVLVFLKTGSLGWLRLVLSGLSGVLVVLLGYVLHLPEKEEKPIRASGKIVLGALLVLVALACALYFVIGLAAFRIVFGALAVLLVPGYALSYVFFTDDDIDLLERLALGVALSIAVVPILVFYVNLLGVRVSVASVLSVVAFVTLGSLAIARKRSAIMRWWKRVRA